MELLLLLFFIIIVCGGVAILTGGIYRIPSGKFGVVYRKYGHWNEADRKFDKVRAYGSPGWQAETLKADQRYILPRPLYKVTTKDRVNVPPGTIGLVVAKDGTRPPLTRTLSKPVECENFENGKAFLIRGGQRGRQSGVLPGDASYAINPELFEVITVNTINAGRGNLTADDLKEIRIPEGTTGVVVVYEGEAPDDGDRAIGRRVPGHQSFQLPSVFLDNGGQRGVQEETLTSGGIYRINPWFAQVELVPTRVLVLEWKKGNKSAGNFDANLDQIRINIEGYSLGFSLSQTIRIPAKAAPRLVSEFGQQEAGKLDSNPVRRFVDRVLSPLVQSYFQTKFANYKILDFVAQASTVCTDLEDRVRQTLSQEWNIEVVRTELHEFEPEGTTLNELLRRRAEERDRKEILEYMKINKEIEAQIEERGLVTEGERRKLEAIELQERIRLLGRDNVAMGIFVAELAKMNVPDVVAGNAESLLGYMSLPVAQDLIAKAFNRNTTAIESNHLKPLNAAPDTDQPEELTSDDSARLTGSR